MKNNPLLILETLDRHLHSPFDLYIFGRSALALGFADSPAAFKATMDVDAILPAKDIQALEENDDFWEAQQKTNEELSESGLYFTHLFEDRQLILTPDWLDHVVGLPEFPFLHLRMFRPATRDLVLTKMMRVDPEDREDIAFLLGQPDLQRDRLNVTFDRAAVPPVPEIAESFVQNRAWIESLES